MRKIVLTCCASVLLVSLVSVGLAGCTRAKPEAVTPTVAVTSTRTITPTQVLTVQAPPTALPLTAGPTIISVAQASPTGIAGTPTAPAPTLTPIPGQFEYTVQWHDTLYSIARRFNTTVEALVALNGLPDANDINVGQVLKVPGTSPPTLAPSREYIVQPGDTLYSIARKYNTTVEAISQANGIVNPWYIHVGQKLIIPQGGSSSLPGGNTYVVQPGDTLYSIAARFGKSVWDIIVANNLSDPHWISVGQVLIIPS